MDNWDYLPATTINCYEFMIIFRRQPPNFRLKYCLSYHKMCSAFRGPSEPPTRDSAPGPAGSLPRETLAASPLTEILDPPLD